ncbi:unnamed protein product [Zymoseptoria tritici ST99CH_1A5]|uniref:Cytochrome c oxidase assembly protein COX20, mitochondrial n=1 Tax=Zymoseptoria tritici ST99CH_1A5 TaxID=1276529 RepID=A0A1Y6LW79_ZYMTR|nr:unnamed protein product [Zymoseptoria tritici ST99CH_1A5]
MADDTRQQQTKEDLSREALTVDPSNKAFTGSQWNESSKPQTFKPPENANLMAGGTQHTAGGQVPEVTFMNALHVGAPVTEIHKRPCVRDALMTGMAAGFALGGVRFIFRAPVFKACNWAVGGFVVSSGGQYQYCLYRRQAEKEGMTRAMEILNRKEMEKKAREQRKEQLRKERRETKDQEQDAKLAALKEKAEGKPWYKVW